MVVKIIQIQIQMVPTLPCGFLLESNWSTDSFRNYNDKISTWLHIPLVENQCTLHVISHLR